MTLLRKESRDWPQRNHEHPRCLTPRIHIQWLNWILMSRQTYQVVMVINLKNYSKVIHSPGLWVLMKKNWGLVDISLLSFSTLESQLLHTNIEHLLLTIRSSPNLWFRTLRHVLLSDKNNIKNGVFTKWILVNLEN